MLTSLASLIDSPDTPWHLSAPLPHLQRLHLTPSSSTPIWCVRDDLLHPFANGNKLRKLDASLPRWTPDTTILSLGGVQSAHCATLAILGASRGFRTHLLLRGEPPPVPTGNLLITLMCAHEVTWVSRDDYADRDALLDRHHAPGVTVVPEGARMPQAVPGHVRLIAALTARLPHARTTPYHLIVDSGTGTSAVALAIGVALLKLPWLVHGVCLLKDQRDVYHDTCRTLHDACKTHYSDTPSLDDLKTRLQWHPRWRPRRFGHILHQDILECRHIARETGVLFDPIYSLAAWNHAAHQMDVPMARRVLIHTGGAMNLFGAAQRRPKSFMTE